MSSAEADIVRTLKASPYEGALLAPLYWWDQDNCTPEWWVQVDELLSPLAARVHSIRVRAEAREKQRGR